MIVKGLLVILLTVATGRPASISASGWFDLPKTSVNSRVVAAAASNERAIFVLSESQDGRIGARFVLYDENLKFQTSWWVAGDVFRVAMTSENVAAAIRRSVRSNDSVDDTYQVCLYGSSHDACIRTESPPEALVAIGKKLFEVYSHRIDELDFQRMRALPHDHSIPLLKDGPVLASAAGERLVRVGSETMNGVTLQLSPRSERAISFMSPQLASHRSTQPRTGIPQFPSAREQLAWHIVGLDDGGLLVFPGRGNFFKGFQVDRFDSSGTYTDTIVLQALSFPEFTKIPAGPTAIGNLHGFIRPSYIIRSANRLILVDHLEGRCVWYVIPTGGRQ